MDSLQRLLSDSLSVSIEQKGKNMEVYKDIFFFIVGGLAGIVMWFFRRDLDTTKAIAVEARNKATKVELDQATLSGKLGMSLTEKLNLVEKNILKEISTLKEDMAEKYITVDECKRIHQFRID